MLPSPNRQSRSPDSRDLGKHRDPPEAAQGPDIPPAPSLSATLRQAYSLMRARNGHLHWWPGETSFEVCLGAILTQNTSWANVERAMANLKRAAALEPSRLLALPEPELAKLLKPAGYFNVKTRRVRSFLEVLVRQFGGDLQRLFAGNLRVVRQRLLAINGIGPETADSMLLYAGGHLSFVIDAYTKRIFQRHGWCGAQATYDDLQTLCVSALSQKARRITLDYWQDYHAQLVIVGKDHCRKRLPRCDKCPLRPLLPSPLPCRDVGGVTLSAPARGCD